MESLQELENLIKELNFPTIESLGNGTYLLKPKGIIVDGKFVEEFDNEMKRIIKEQTK